MSHILRQVEKMPINTSNICITAKTNWVQTPFICQFLSPDLMLFYIADKQANMAVISLLNCSKTRDWLMKLFDPRALKGLTAQSAQWKKIK
jgi:hypothetical protein